MQMMRSVWKHKPVRYTVETTAVFVFIILAVTLPARATRPEAPDLPQALLPGHPLPDDAQCDTLPPKGVGGWQYCHVLSDGTEVELTYDTEQRMIVHTD